jgi:hypothetical protein
MLRTLFLGTLLLFVSFSIKAQQAIQAFIPAGYSILDSSTVDLNLDQLKDCLLILKDSSFEAAHEEHIRPMLLLMGDAQGKFSPWMQNDSVVLCSACGGMMGDPYLGMDVSPGRISLEFYGGAVERWSRTIVFEYDSSQQEMLLKSDAGITFSVMNPDKETPYISNEEDFGKMTFRRFNYEKSW